MPDYSDVQFTRWVAATFTPACPYVVGDTYATRPTPRFEFKAGAVGYTGGGYPRLRSSERGPESGHGSNDVFVPIHRLAALVWCYSGDHPLAEDAAHLREMDVHHELGFPSANLPEYISVESHSSHASITRDQLRGWAKDAKRERERRQSEEFVPDEQACAECGEEANAQVAGTDYCLSCATTAAKGRDVTVELL